MNNIENYEREREPAHVYTHNCTNTDRKGGCYCFSKWTFFFSVDILLSTHWPQPPCTTVSSYFPCPAAHGRPVNKHVQVLYCSEGYELVLQREFKTSQLPQVPCLSVYKAFPLLWVALSHLNKSRSRYYANHNTQLSLSTDASKQHNSLHSILLLQRA